MADYALIHAQAESLTEGIDDLWANLANLSALLYDGLENVNWAGFYRVQKEKLVLGPFQGKPACVFLPIGRGVCALAARENRTVVVPDVHAFDGHIACDSASASEIVLPTRDADGKAAFVLDIDSPSLDRFGKSDEEGLTALVKLIEKSLPSWRA